MFHSFKATNSENARQGIPWFKNVLFGVFMVGIGVISVAGITGCTPDDPPVDDPLEILSLEISPDSGITTSSTVTFDASGTGTVEVKWLNRYSESGLRVAHTCFIDVDGEDEYVYSWNAGDTLTYYYQVFIYDSANTELIKSSEVFYGSGDLPRDPPSGECFASPDSGRAPLIVSFKYTDPLITDWEWSTYGDAAAFEGNIHTYDQPGIYEAIWTASNPWGEHVDTVLVHVMPSAPEIDSGVVIINHSDAIAEFYIYWNCQELYDAGNEVLWYFRDGGGGLAAGKCVPYNDPFDTRKFSTYDSIGTYTARWILNCNDLADTFSTSYYIPFID